MHIKCCSKDDDESGQFTQGHRRNSEEEANIERIMPPLVCARDIRYIGNWMCKVSGLYGERAQQQANCFQDHGEEDNNK